jgi:5-methylcytosine-specific restriction endonuclease McrA
VLLNLMDLDLGIKSDYISDDEKMVCLMKSKNTCPSCGTVLTLHNVQFDHYNPKSLCSASELRLLCKSCNLKKNNMTIDSLNKLF